jgi:2-polyprenyl-6-methoxyphenol hydroxylase-like FAD-dependent oxidoreductase
MRIVCVGGGPAGLYFSILMKQADPGHDVVVLERRARGYAGGWGVTVWDDLLVDLQATDEVTADRIAQAAFRWRGLVLDMQGERVEHEGGCYAIARAVVLDILTERATALGVDIRFDADVADTTGFADADVVVACDGVRSVLRDRDREGFGTNIVAGKNKFVWLGTTGVFDKFTFAFARSDAGWIWFYAYAFDELASTCIVECSEETWRGLGLHDASACESLRTLEQLFADQLKGESLMSSPGREDATLPWLNFPVVTNERWYFGNVVLKGDAAHTTHFSIGSGMRLALQDAISLARELQRKPTVATAFAAYDADRRAALVGPQTEARFSQRWFEEVPRYTDLPAAAFFALLRSRRDPLLPKISPRLYYRLYKTVDSVAFLRTLRHRVGPMARTLYGKRVRRQANTV